MLIVSIPRLQLPLTTLPRESSGRERVWHGGRGRRGAGRSGEGRQGENARRERERKRASCGKEMRSEKRSRWGRKGSKGDVRLSGITECVKNSAAEEEEEGEGGEKNEVVKLQGRIEIPRENRIEKNRKNRKRQTDKSIYIRNGSLSNTDNHRHMQTPIDTQTIKQDKQKQKEILKEEKVGKE